MSTSTSATLEADWISRTIEARGGICPQPLAAEVLDLHHEYLVSSGGGSHPVPCPGSAEPTVR